MKAVMKYPGSKWKLADWIISYFPKHHSYLEPFFGSGAPPPRFGEIQGAGVLQLG